jgi:hypothetical protein
MGAPTKHLLFLGAGASMPLSLPGSVQLVKKFERAQYRTKSNYKRGARQLISSIKKVIQFWGFDYDSESFYEVLQGHSEPVRYLKSAGVFASSMSAMQLMPVNSDNVLTKLIANFEDFLIANYYRDSPALRRMIVDYYNRLLSKTSGRRRWRRGQPNWRTNSFEIFTTNYDYNVEIYSESITKELVDGKRLAADGTVIFTPDDYDRKSASVNLYKLHGSVGLSRTARGVVSEIPPPVPSQKRLTDRTYSKVMVYGVEKNILQEPYFELLWFLKTRLAQLNECVVIGYSFRDPWIVQIFRDVIRKSRGSFRLTYVDPHATENLKRLQFPLNSVTAINKTAESWLGLPTK